VVYDEVEKPGLSNLLTIYATLTGRRVADIEREFAGKGYGDFKKALGEVVVDFVTPFRDQTLELLEDRAELDRVLADGAARAREVAGPTLQAVYDRVGFVSATP
jgi:tryptophanyl-tRNA synthetase